MDRKSIRQDLLQIGILDGGHFLFQYLLRGAPLAHEQRQLVPFHGDVPQCLGSLTGLRAGVYEYQHLIPILPLTTCLLVTYLVLKPKTLEGVPFRDAQVLHLQWHRAVRMIEEEHTLLRINTQEGRDVGVVRECRRESHESDRFGGSLDLTYDTCHDALQHRTAIIVK